MRRALRPEALPLALAFAAGAATVLSFAPFEIAWLPAVTLAVLFLQWQAAAPRAAVRLGFAFGVGLFGAGVSWVYIALHTFGAMAAVLAAIGTAAFCLYLALFPALAGFLATRWTRRDSVARAVAAAGAWALAEWLRSWLLSGFPWLALGYAQLPLAGPTPLAGYAPIGGVGLVSLALAAIAAAVALCVDALVQAHRLRIAGALAMIIAVIAAGAILRGTAFTAPAGKPLTVSLVQGNVLQDQKFDPAFRESTYRSYVDLARGSAGRVVVLPESALPEFLDEVPVDVLRALAALARERDGGVLAGVFTLDPPVAGDATPRYYNSVASLDASGVQLYRKRHLVPFGETIPLEPVVGWFIRSVLHIPLANQSAGADDQPALAIAGQRIAVNICYEDVFGADIRPQARTATILVNVTNDAWYGRSFAAPQHNQIAAMRALETGRPLLRATNTGITSAIDHDGREIARLPWFTRDTLTIAVTGRQGVTPYVALGDALAAGIAFALYATAVLLGAVRGRARQNR